MSFKYVRLWSCIQKHHYTISTISDFCLAQHRQGKIIILVQSRNFVPLFKRINL